MSTNSEVKNYFQDKIIKKYDILYDFWPKSMIVWHLGQKYDVRRNVWRLAALLYHLGLVQNGCGFHDDAEALRPLKY